MKKRMKLKNIFHKIVIYQKYLEMKQNVNVYSISSLINDSGADVIDARYDKKIQKYIRATAMYPSRQRPITRYTKKMRKKLQNI